MQKPSFVPLLIFVAWIYTLFNIKFFTLQPEFSLFLLPVLRNIGNVNQSLENFMITFFGLTLCRSIKFMRLNTGFQPR
jgi:hypothetical protein